MQRHLICRRSFLSGSISAGIVHSFGKLFAQNKATAKKVLSVRGPIDANSFGAALPHEHIICDFIGADATGNHRWNRDKVFHRMLPYVEVLKREGVSTFFDCTPDFIGRDPVILKRLSIATGLNIVTNTGFYGGANDKFIPKHAYSMSAQEMATHWTQEFEQGIDETGIRPGFIKIGVDSIESKMSHLSKIDTTIVHAAAIVSQRTRLTVTCHTGGGYAGLSALRLFVQHGGSPSSFIVAHADNHGLPINQKVADLGGWVSFDGIGRRPLKQHLEIVPAMLSHRTDRLLISQDNGWYSVGELNGGEVRGYTDLHQTFLPALMNAGISKDQLNQLLQINPWNAFAI